MTLPDTLSNAACDVLNTQDANEKVRLSFLYAKAWEDGLNEQPRPKGRGIGDLLNESTPQAARN